jgi:hypothetical protein
MRLLYALTALALFVSPATSQARMPCPHPTVDRLEGEWLGVGDLGGVARLELDRRGHGLLTVQESSGASPVSIYRVTSLVVDGYILNFALSPVAWPPETALTGESRCGRMTLDRLVLDNYRDVQRFNMQRTRSLLDGLESVQRDSR